jgi:type I restriction enzyme S subunit
MILKYRIPVPPLEVQREIVRVLDLFTTLEAELEAELEARGVQYAHYRDSLLAFRDVAGIRWTPMGELGQFHRGRRFTKRDVVEDGIPAIHYGEIYTRYGAVTRSVATHLQPELASGLRYAKHGDVVIVDVGETVEDVGKAVAWLGEGEVAIHDHSFAFRHSQNPAYLSYYMQTALFQHAKAKYVARTKVKTLSMPGIAKIQIPIPPLEEQARIVAILDKFDTLVNDLSIGLPAELAARRKQYEYYRDRLLTFEEAVA